MPGFRHPGDAAGSPVVLLALVALAIVTLASLFDGSFIQNDSAQYLSMARSLVRGYGVATSLVWTDEHYQLGSLPVPQTNLPPGYPVLIALVTHLGVEPQGAAFLVSLACFSAIPFLLYIVLRGAGQPRVRSLAVSGAWVVVPILWFNVLACLSEMSYTLLTLLGLVCVMRSERDPANRNAWLLAAGTLAGLAFTVRYAGIIYIASVGLLFLVRAARRRDMRSVRQLVIVSSPPAAFVLAFFARSYSLTGRFAGGHRLDDDISISDVFHSAYWAFSDMFGFSKSGLLRGGLPEWLLVLCVLTALGCLASGLRPRIDRSVLRTLGADTLRALSLIYVVGSVVFVVIVAGAHEGGVVAARYLLPLIPFVLLLLPFGLGLIRWAPAGHRQKRMATALRWGVLAAFLAGQVNVIGHYRGALLESPYRQIDRALQQPFGAGTLRDFVKQRVSLHRPLLGNEAQLTGAVLDRPAVGLPGPWYTGTTWTEAETHRVVKKYGVGYILFFPELFNDSAPWVANQTFFRDLKHGMVPPWLAPAFSSATVQLYQVNGTGA